jgi:hypothetical protein
MSTEPKQEKEESNLRTEIDGLFKTTNKMLKGLNNARPDMAILNNSGSDCAAVGSLLRRVGYISDELAVAIRKLCPATFDFFDCRINELVCESNQYTSAHIEGAKVALESKKFDGLEKELHILEVCVAGQMLDFACRPISRRKGSSAAVSWRGGG